MRYCHTFNGFFLHQRKKSFMIPSLVFWGILLSFWIFYVMFEVGTSGMKSHHDLLIASLTLLAVLTSSFIFFNKISDWDVEFLFYSISVFYVACFIFAIVICISMKSTKNRSSTESHHPPNGETYTAIDEKDAFRA